MSWWIIFWLIIVNLSLIIYYKNKINDIKYPGFVYYENPLSIGYYTSFFYDDFDTYFIKQYKYFDNLFEKQEKFMKRNWNLLDSNKFTIDTSNKAQQIYQKYYLYDWKIYSYKINYNNWSINWDIVVNDANKKDILVEKIQELWLEFSDLDTNVFFSWKIDNIDPLLKILD